MVDINDLINYLDGLLEAPDFKDPSYNGLQIAGRRQIKTLATACTASLDAIEAAVKNNADVLLVHHGLFWKGADPRIIGNYHSRIKALIDHDINLIAYHLPMDANLSYGNNAFIAKHIGGAAIEHIEPGNKFSIGVRTKLAKPLQVKELAACLGKLLMTKVMVLGRVDADKVLDDIAICSGSGSFLIDNNKCPDFQALITGDVNEQTWHMANETGTVVFVVGHHASEQIAMHRLGEGLANKFELKHEAISFKYELDAVVY